MRERQLTPTLKWRALAVILSAVLILGAATLSLHAQPPAAAPNPDFVHAIWVVKADGVLKLAGADGNLLFQITDAPTPRRAAVDEKRGTVWILAQQGLRVYGFDGQFRFSVPVTSLDAEDPEDDAGGHAVLRVNANNGGAWLATGVQLRHFDVQGQLLKNLSFISPIKALALDKGTDRLWVATETAVSAYEENGTPVNLNIDLGHYPQVQAIDTDAELSYLWVALGSQLRRYDLASGSLQFTQAIDQLRKVASDSRGGAWLATAQELSRLDATVKIVVRETPFAQNEGDILVLAADPLDQSVWAAARQALKHIDAQGAELFAKSFSPPPIRDLALYRDATPPQLSFTAPTDGARLPTTTPQLILLLSYSDTGVGVDTSTLSIKASGNPLNVTCRFDTTNATCTPTTTLPLGANTLTATIKDFAGNQSAQATVSFTINQPPVAANDTATTPAGTAVAIAVLANDSDPDGDQLSVVGFTQGAHGTVSFANNIATYTPAPGFPPGTTAATDSFTYTITDGRGANATAAVTVTVTPVNQPPQVSAGPDQTITLPATASLHGSATDDGLPNPPGMVTVQWTEVSGPRTVTFGNAASLDTTASFTVAGVYVLRLTASDSALTASAQATVTVNAPSGGGLPPDPSTVAPPVEPGVAATIGSTTAFLYTGANPIQSGVAPGTIDAKRAAVLRGRVLDKANAPLPGVTITILNHAEFGQTLSRTDGMFDLAVSGGGLLTVNYAKAGLISAQRQVQVPWQDFVLLPGVVLIPPDSQITPVDLTATAPIQVARGSVQTDADGTRQATLLFPQGTQATMVMPNGTTQSITHLSVRATEFTVGPNGPLSMPAELPPTSGYTYAVMFTADEAKAAGATNVEFASPIPFYVENFLNFPVGTVAPLGAYDAAKGQWVASDSGQVVKILDITNNLADLDTTGNGTADNGAALGITLAERQQLATLYQAGQTLWRVAIPHFDFGWDINWGVAPPPDGKPPNPPGPPENDPLPNDLCGGSCCDEGSSVEGSIIDCGTQALGETAEVTGTPFSLNYQSSRVPGRRAAYTMTIPLSGATVPASLKRIDLRIILLGQLITQSFPAAPSQTTSFTWDGKDVYGRTVNGAQAASVRVGFVYNAVYAKTSRFGYNGNGLFITGNTSRELTIWGGTQTVSLGTWDARQSGLGGWALSVHHTYDPGGRLLYLGTGEQRSVDATLSPIISTVAGNGTGGDGGPATAAGLSGPLAIAAAPDGSFYIADTGHNCIRRVGPDGIISTVAGNGTPGSSGDGGPAIAASLNSPAGVAVGTDGSLYIVSDVGNQPVRRVGPDGFISTVAGNGTPGFSGDGGPATAASLVSPVGVAAAPDGSLYIADLGNQRIRRVGRTASSARSRATEKQVLAATGVRQLPQA